MAASLLDAKGADPVEVTRATLLVAVACVAGVACAQSSGGTSAAGSPDAASGGDVVSSYTCPDAAPGGEPDAAADAAVACAVAGAYCNYGYVTTGKVEVQIACRCIGDVWQCSAQDITAGDASTDGEAGRDAGDATTADSGDASLSDSGAHPDASDGGHDASHDATSDADGSSPVDGGSDGD